MSAYAKSIVGAVAAALIAGITAWQTATSDGFQVVDLLPVAIAAVGALLTFVVPNVPELPEAKAWVSGTLAVLTAFSTGLTGLSPKADAVQVVFAIAGAFLSWYVPNLPAQNLVTAPADDGGGHTVTDVPPAQAPAVDPTADALAQLDMLDQQAAADSPQPGGEGSAMAEPLPIEAEAQQAAATQTAVQPAATPPAAPAPVPAAQPTA